MAERARQIDHVLDLAEKNSRSIASILTGLEYIRESLSLLQSSDIEQSKKINKLQRSDVTNKLVRKIVFGLVGLLLTAFFIFLLTGFFNKTSI